MCALYVRCALSVLQNECRKVWGARYTLGVRYRSENTVSHMTIYFNHQAEHQMSAADTSTNLNAKLLCKSAVWILLFVS